MKLNESLKELAKQGCYPCIGCRGGNNWRAHVNGAGNFWADSNTPHKALVKAIKSWKSQGKPMDGYAAIATAERVT